MLNSMCQVSFITTFCITLELRQFKKDTINDALELMTDAYNSLLNASIINLKALLIICFQQNSSRMRPILTHRDRVTHNLWFR